ncbi:MAG: hypothetical protein ACMUIA_03650 [bacterium]
MIIKKKLTCFFLVMVGMVTLSLIHSPISQAQYWTALPPYNTLWPLWSPALSPVDSVSGLPVPIISELTPLTVLPVQPGLTWNPNLDYPWLLYNTPLGMAYYDPFGGVNLWPEPSLIKPNGNPLPLLLPTDYAFLPPTDSSWLIDNVPLGNSAIIPFLSAIPGALMGGILPTFLTAVDLLPPLIIPPPVPTVILPPPVPTAVLPPPVPTPFIPAPVPTTAVLAPPVPTVVLPPPVPTPVIPAPVPTALASPIVPTAVTPLVTPVAPAPTTALVPPIVTTPVVPTAAISALFPLYPFNPFYSFYPFI